MRKLFYIVKKKWYKISLFFGLWKESDPYGDKIDAAFAWEIAGIIHD